MGHSKSNFLQTAIVVFVIMSVLPNWAHSDDPVYVNRSTTTMLSFTGDAVASGAFDLDRDGKKDLILGVKEAAWLQDNTTLDGVPQFLSLPLNVLDGDNFPQNLGSINIQGFLAADFDNDGYTDFYVPSTDPDGHQLYRCYGGFNPPRFYNVTISTGLSSATLGIQKTHTRGGSWADYDGDGFIDLLLEVKEDSSSPATQVLLHNEPGAAPGGRVFVDRTGQAGLTPTGDAHSLWADFNGDHDLDLLVMGPTGETKYFINTNGTFVNGESWLLPGYNEEFSDETNLGTIADVNNDGQLDVVFMDRTQIGYFSSSGTYNGEAMLTKKWSTDWSYSLGFVPTDIDVFDYTLDGKTDIMVAGWNRISIFGNEPGLDGNNNPISYAYPNLVGGTRLEFGQTGNPCQSFLVTDWVEDGLGDVFLDRGDVDPFFYKKEYGGPNAPGNWVGIRLEALDNQNNYHGIGSTVTLYYGSTTQAQLVDGGSLDGQQSGLDLVFGVGSYTGSTVLILVRWPNGLLQVETVPVGEYTTIRSGTPTIDDSSVNAYTEYHMGSMEHDWIFECDVTGGSGDPGTMEVIFELPISPSSCTPAHSVLSEDEVSAVDVTVTPNGSSWHYKLVWSDTDCLAGCLIPFHVSINEKNYVAVSGSHNLRILTCMGGL